MESSLNVYAVSDDGEHFKISYKGKKTLKAEKSSSQVLVFADVAKRQLWIWTGLTATVRKKFVASRVAQALRFEIGTVKGTQSIEQGEEPRSFWEFIGNRTTAGLLSQKSAPTPASNVSMKPVAVSRTRKRSTQVPESKPKKKSKKGTKKKTRKKSKSITPIISEEKSIPSIVNSTQSEDKTFLDSFLKIFHIPKKRTSFFIKKDINPTQAVLISEELDLTLSIDKILFSASSTGKIPLSIFEVEHRVSSMDLSDYPPTLILYPNNGKSYFLDLNLKPKANHHLYLAGPSNSFIYIEFKK